MTNAPALRAESPHGPIRITLFSSDATLGSATATGKCSATVERADLPAGGFFPVGTTTITYTATDPSGNSVSSTQLVMVVDTTPPAISKGTLDDSTGDGICTATIESLGTTAADNCGGTNLTGIRSDGAPLAAPFSIDTTTFAWTVTDAAGIATAATLTVKVSDRKAPSLTPPPALSLVTGLGATTCGLSDGTLGTPAASDNCSFSVTRAGVPDANVFPIRTTTVTWTATDPSGSVSATQTDPAGNTKNATQTVTVTNPTPRVAVTSPASGALYAAGSTITMSGTFTDNAGDLHTARWVCDALTFPGTVNESAKTVTGTMNFTPAGVYCVRLEVTDQCGNTASTTTIGVLQAMAVVYDPSAGFVTGGGWIDSPTGAYPAVPALTGKANFGFVSKHVGAHTASWKSVTTAGGRAASGVYYAVLETAKFRGEARMILIK